MPSAALWTPHLSANKARDPRVNSATRHAHIAPTLIGIRTEDMHMPRTTPFLARSTGPLSGHSALRPLTEPTLGIPKLLNKGLESARAGVVKRGGMCEEANACLPTASRHRLPVRESQINTDPRRAQTKSALVELPPHARWWGPRKADEGPTNHPRNGGPQHAAGQRPPPLLLSGGAPSQWADQHRDRTAGALVVSPFRTPPCEESSPCVCLPPHNGPKLPAGNWRRGTHRNVWAHLGVRLYFRPAHMWRAIHNGHIH